MAEIVSAALKAGALALMSYLRAHPEVRNRPVILALHGESVWRVLGRQQRYTEPTVLAVYNVLTDELVVREISVPRPEFESG